MKHASYVFVEKIREDGAKIPLLSPLSEKTASFIIRMLTGGQKTQLACYTKGES